jgi:molybdopterin molybdotransferase
MDGYAVRAGDVAGADPTHPVVLSVVGSIHAGDLQPPPALLKGQALRIMTGAPLPPGSDAVIRVEDTDGEASVPGRVRVRVAVDSGRYVRPGGEDVRAGDRVLASGRVVGPGVIGLAAAMGHDRVHVHRRPSVALLATGDELRGPERYDDVVRGRGIPESNTPMLAAMVRAEGGVVSAATIARDDERDLGARVDESEESDVLVTIGGASMGEADLVKRVLDERGFRQDFWRVRMRPGSPFSFGYLPRGGRQQPVFGLPGNPASAFVTFELFVRPFLRRLAGHTECLRPHVTCVAEEPLRGPEDLAAYLRVSLSYGSGRPRARLTGPQGSGLVKGLGLADGLAVLPVGTDSVPAESDVRVILLQGASAHEAP